MSTSEVIGIIVTVFVLPFIALVSYFLKDFHEQVKEMKGNIGIIKDAVIKEIHTHSLDIVRLSSRIEKLENDLHFVRESLKKTKDDLSEIARKQ